MPCPLFSPWILTHPPVCPRCRVGYSTVLLLSRRNSIRYSVFGIPVRCHFVSVGEVSHLGTFKVRTKLAFLFLWHVVHLAAHHKTQINFFLLWGRLPLKVDSNEKWGVLGRRQYLGLWRSRVTWIWTCHFCLFWDCEAGKKISILTARGSTSGGTRSFLRNNYAQTLI
jgi:hypothetical protein